MLTDNCQDIFYKIKKQILDKLDVILQKINLEIINSKHLQSISEQFTFIELSQFQNQISALFLYFDKLYESLNSSLSEYNSPLRQNQQNQILQIARLKQTNIILQKQNLEIKDKLQILIKSNNQLIIHNSISKQQLSKMQQQNRELKNNGLEYKCALYKNNELVSRMRILNERMDAMKKEYHRYEKWIKDKLCKFKFTLLEDRVQIIGKMKKTFETYKYQNQNNFKICQNNILNSQKTSIITHNSLIQDFYIQKQIMTGCSECDADKILDQLDNIIDLCKN